MDRKQIVLNNFRESLATDYWFHIAHSINMTLKLDGVLRIDHTGTSAHLEFRLQDTLNKHVTMGTELPAYTRTFFNRAVTIIYDAEALEKFRKNLSQNIRILLVEDYVTKQRLEASIFLTVFGDFQLEFALTNTATGTTLTDSNLAAQTRRMVDHLWVD